MDWLFSIQRLGVRTSESSHAIPHLVRFFVVGNLHKNFDRTAAGAFENLCYGSSCSSITGCHAQSDHWVSVARGPPAGVIGAWLPLASSPSL
eukprot:992356-Prorocentrum_minimum.AAC.1